MDSLDEGEREAAEVQKVGHRRVTLEQLRATIVDRQFVNPDFAPHVTVCMAKCINGFTVIGMSAPADAMNFNAELGRKFAEEDCIRQLWRLEGYMLCERLSSPRSRRID